MRDWLFIYHDWAKIDIRPALLSLHTYRLLLLSSARHLLVTWAEEDRHEHIPHVYSIFLSRWIEANLRCAELHRVDKFDLAICIVWTSGKIRTRKTQTRLGNLHDEQVAVRNMKRIKNIKWSKRNSMILPVRIVFFLYGRIPLSYSLSILFFPYLPYFEHFLCRNNLFFSTWYHLFIAPYI